MADLNPDHEHDVPAHPALFGFRDTAPGSFVPPPVASVEAAGVRRGRRRTAMVAAAVVLAVLGGVGVAVAAGRPGPAPLPQGVTPSPLAPAPTTAPAPTATPSPTATLSPPPGASSPTPSASAKSRLTAVPDSAFLALSDLWPGYRVVPDSEQASGDWVLGYWTQHCAANTEFPRTDSASRRDRGFTKGTGDTAEAVFERVELEPDLGRQRMDYWRQWAARCATSGNLTVTVVESGFGGNDSLLIKVVQRADGVEYGGTYALIRAGDLIAEVAGRHEDTREIAVRAARRMCGVTGTC